MVMTCDRGSTDPCLALSVAVVALVLSGCAALTGGPFNEKPGFIRGEAFETRHDGPSDDLLTAGLGKTGLAATAPAVSSPPTAAELRRLAIYNNYRALVGMTPGVATAGSMGPTSISRAATPPGESLIPGVEFLASAGTPRENVTLMVQGPDSFAPADACIVTGPSSGSRGVCGAIATSGEWGLKRGCAGRLHRQGHRHRRA